jgi:hypothetical protein
MGMFRPHQRPTGLEPAEVTLPSLSQLLVMTQIPTCVWEHCSENKDKGSRLRGTAFKIRIWVKESTDGVLFPSTLFLGFSVDRLTEQSQWSKRQFLSVKGQITIEFSDLNCLQFWFVNKIEYVNEQNRKVWIYRKKRAEERRNKSHKVTCSFQRYFLCKAGTGRQNHRKEKEWINIELFLVTFFV